MATRTAKARHERGVAVRLDLTLEEYRELRMIAVGRDESVSAMITRAVKRILRAGGKSQAVLPVGENDETGNNSI